MLRNRFADYLNESHQTHDGLAQRAQVNRTTITRLVNVPDSVPRSDFLNPLCDRLWEHPLMFIEYEYPDGTTIDPLLRGVITQLRTRPGTAGMQAAARWLLDQALGESDLSTSETIE